MAQRGINKALILGRVGQDPEIRATQNGDTVANFNIATSEVWKDQQGQKQEKTEWHKIAVFGRLAEIVRDYVHKGSQIHLEGRLQTRKWQDKTGQERSATEIVATEILLLGGREDRENAPARPSVNGNRAAPAPAQVEDYEDDIPF